MKYKINWHTRKLEKNKERIYYKFDDGGHGWLRVHIKDIIKAGIEKLITHWSYIKGKYVYLEEDCDMSLFIDKMKDIDIITKYTKWSKIREFESYSVETLNNNLTLLES